MHFLTVVVKVFDLPPAYGALVVKMLNGIHVVFPMITSIGLKNKKLERLAFLDQRSVAK